MSNYQIEADTTDRIEELHYEPVAPKYKSVQMASAVIAYAVMAALALLLLLAESPWWCVAAEAVIVVSFIINIAILRKAYQAKGFALREHDITYRSGVIFPKITTVPFSRIQQVSICQNPVSKFFGLYSIDIDNGAQGMSSLAVQGLTKDKAEGIKNVITQRLKHS
ncbi:PH domain-containing protein [Muribaculum sp.]|uniref:PH domain-containing protein n=1 Tax=Muribaculum sp. TaxID=1918611 RepID=UPI0023C3C4E4|nr:PH domain-containing protein [Muribaculum sp.]MDE5705695.1 PH domain-containing protein [Muribaculum sp.]